MAQNGMAHTSFAVVKSVVVAVAIAVQCRKKNLRKNDRVNPPLDFAEVVYVTILSGGLFDTGMIK